MANGGTLEIGQNPAVMRLRRLMTSPTYKQLQASNPALAQQYLNHVMGNDKPMQYAGAATQPRGGPGGASAPKMAGGEASRRLKMTAEAQQVLAETAQLRELYDKRIAPKMKAGAISNFSQGARYVAPTTFGQPDPDVEAFIQKTGPLSQAMNAYYASASGGKGGVGAFEQITKPHIPSAPSSMADLTGLPGIFGEGKRQWNLEQQRQWLDGIDDWVKVQEGMKQPQTYTPWTPSGGATPSALPSPGAAAGPSSDADYLTKHGLTP